MSGLQGQTEDTKDTSAIAQPSAVQKNDKSLDDEKSSFLCYNGLRLITGG